MNHSNNSSQSGTSWNHSTVVAVGVPPVSGQNVAGHQHGGSPGTASGADFEAKLASSPGSSPQSSNQSGTTLKEHDLLGMSEVSSSRLDKTSVQGRFHEDGHQNEELNLNLNLGTAEARPGPEESRRKVDGGFPFQRSVNSVQEQGAVAESENGSFLGGVDGGKGASGSDPSALVSDMCSSSAEQVAEGTGCRPLIDSESLQKWHGGDRVVSGENLRLGISLSQPKRVGERNYQEKPLEGGNQQQHVVASDERSWQERNPHTIVQDVSSGENVQDRQAMSERVPQEQGAEKPEQERLKHEGFLPEKRILPEGKALPALQPPEPRFSHDLSSSEPSPRQRDFLAAPSMWQPQVKARPMEVCRQYSATDLQPQQVSHPAQQDEVARGGYTAALTNFPGSRHVYPLTKAGVTGAKRPFDTMETRNFNDGRGGLVPNPVPASSTMMNSSVSSSEADGKPKAQPPLYQSWAPKAAPAWQMLQHNGGSFGPFPSQSSGRAPAMPTVSKPPAETLTGAGVGDSSQKAWEARKSLQEQAAGQKMTSPDTVLGSVRPSTPPEAASAPRAAPPAVGWPPIRSFRKSTIANQPRPTPVEVQTRPAPPPPPQQAASPASVASQPNSLFFKVYMDGVPIGRKVDLKTNSSYEKLSIVLEDMFRGFVNGQQSGQTARDVQLPSDKRSFLRGSEYVLTYEDQEGDLMLVGDVPWTMFIDTVKRLRIMKGSEAIGLAGSRTAEKVNKTPAPV